MKPTLDPDWVRGHFPALATEWVLADNAGGSAVLRSVADQVHEHLLRSPVQLGASYPLSQEASERVANGKRAAELLVNADRNEVVLGPSSTALGRLLADALLPLFAPGDEVIVTNLDHEANIGPWRALEAHGLRLREWRLDPASLVLRVEDLEPLLTNRTRLVCFTHCSNVIGAYHDVRAITERVHAAGAWVCVDGVAFAPHQRVDVKALGVDFYLLSLYKTFGPHLGLLFGRRELLARAASQNHFFVGEDEVPYKLEPGNVNYELVSSVPAIVNYLEELDRHHHGATEGTSATDTSRSTRIKRAYEAIGAHESQLTARLCDFLDGHPLVRRLGSQISSQRAPTVSFVVQGLRSSEVPPKLEQHGIAARWGHFYAHRAIRDLGLVARDGVVRISLAHYNTADEVERICTALDTIL